MLFTDIKTYFIESEEEKGEEEAYIGDLHSCMTIDSLIQNVAEYHGYDDAEAASYIITQVCKF
jgi:hypothetical protein